MLRSINIMQKIVLRFDYKIQRPLEIREMYLLAILISRHYFTSINAELFLTR